MFDPRSLRRPAFRARPATRALPNPADDLTAVTLRFTASAVTLAVAVFLTLVR